MMILPTTLAHAEDSMQWLTRLYLLLSPSSEERFPGRPKRASRPRNNIIDLGEYGVDKDTIGGPSDSYRSFSDVSDTHLSR